MIEFTIPGEAVAQGRPRASVQRGKVQMRDPEKSKDFKSYVKLLASQHRPSKLLTGPLAVELRVYKPILQSFSNKKKLEAKEGILRPVTKPDLDNHAKGVLDAMNKIIYNDDSQIVTLLVSKFYSDYPRVEVFIKELEG
ncbi:RusA family crossover junction endodeoxyribonuclease [Metabacillus herbersteinensis]|uniref:RusA family crossover junction endodeoxyribonuclease n=1 Tax=Metabacillus herbersteinensis TaxID=283816 RepID=A0ABV6GC20_9BACI